MNRWYVTMTWHDWPEGGSFATIVEAESYVEAEQKCIAEMKAVYAEEWGEELDDDFLNERADNWTTVDCFNLDIFIEDNRRKPEDVWASDPTYSVEHWQYEVENDDTRLGYWDWVQHQKDQAHE